MSKKGQRQRRRLQASAPPSGPIPFNQREDPANQHLEGKPRRGNPENNGTPSTLPLVKKVFVSYSRKDSTSVDSLELSLKEHGLQTWVDRGQIQPGNRFLPQIQQGIDDSYIVVVVLYPNSVHSEYVEAEYHYAHDKKKVIIPIVIQA